MPKADSPFEVLEKVSDNAYKEDLPGDCGVSCTFNVVDLNPYYEDTHLENLWANSFLEGEYHVPLEGNLDQEKLKLSNQEPKKLNQESKEVILLYSSPWPVVAPLGGPVVDSGGLPSLDPETAPHFSNRFLTSVA